MRISDWSSDVCSSDLDLVPREGQIVEFYEILPGGGRRLVGTASSADGSLTFTPSTTEGTPVIDAVVLQDGFARRSVPVVKADAPRTGSLAVALAGRGAGEVTSVPAGIDCGTTCEAQIATGTAVTLTAAPAAGSRFAGWEGACTGTSTCQLTVDSLHSVTARLEPAPAGEIGRAHV